MPAEVNHTVVIDIDALRVGMFIQLEVSWIKHPFPTSKFRVSSQEQIRVLREIGVKNVRYVPGKSAFLADTSSASTASEQPPDAQVAAAPPAGVFTGACADTARPVAETLADVCANLAERHGSQRFRQATVIYSQVCGALQTAPLVAREQVESLIGVFVDELHAQGTHAVRLLSENFGERSAVHAVNVAVLALLLGRALGMGDQALKDLGVAALLHDMGKTQLPAHLAEPGALLTSADMQRYHGHVGLSVELGERMKLCSDILIALAQHHEMVDGSGFPLHLCGDDISRYGQILALVNRYDRLCDPLHGAQALTPHEAISRLFAVQSDCFDATVLKTFIRMMGVYPPGSLVQLVDGRFALVVLVDAERPLRPLVLPYQAGASRAQVPLLDLTHSAAPGIRRSLRPAQLPRNVLDFLMPQPRISYFFERAASPQVAKDSL